MRDVYHDELDDVGRKVVQGAHLVSIAMDTATKALLAGGADLADRVVAEDRFVDQLSSDIEDHCFALIAQQQPVATDLRVLIGSIRLAGDLERMGDLAGHVAKVARRRLPERAVPADVRDVIAAMGATARLLVTKAAEVVDGRDIELAREIEHEDDHMDELRRTLFSKVLSPQWPHGVEAAIDLTLLGRYYERYADHAVAVARQVMFIVTGEPPAMRRTPSSAGPGGAANAQIRSSQSP